MNVPNKLTVSRLIMVPLFVISFVLPEFSSSLKLISTVLMIVFYILIEMSDALDGYIARSRHLVTDLGKVLDPFSDTLAHITFFLCFYGKGLMPFLALAIIVWREFSIVFVRMLLMKTGVVMAANIFGKIKTVLYAVVSLMSIISIIMSEFFTLSATYSLALTVAFYLAAAASLISFLIYLKGVFDSKALSNMTR